MKSRGFNRVKFAGRKEGKAAAASLFDAGSPGSDRFLAVQLQECEAADPGKRHFSTRVCANSVFALPGRDSYQRNLTVFVR
jgi:hypothetical protein